MAKKLRSKRKTYKKIAGRRIQTNPKFTKDDETEIPGTLLRDLINSAGQLVRFGIAVGRARATASGKRKK